MGNRCVYADICQHNHNISQQYQIKQRPRDKLKQKQVYIKIVFFENKFNGRQRRKNQSYINIRKQQKDKAQVQIFKNYNQNDIKNPQNQVQRQIKIPQNYLKQSQKQFDKRTSSSLNKSQNSFSLTNKSNIQFSFNKQQKLINKSININQIQYNKQSTTIQPSAGKKVSIIFQQNEYGSSGITILKTDKLHQSTPNSNINSFSNVKNSQNNSLRNSKNQQQMNNSIIQQLQKNKSAISKMSAKHKKDDDDQKSVKSNKSIKSLMNKSNYSIQSILNQSNIDRYQKRIQKQQDQQKILYMKHKILQGLIFNSIYNRDIQSIYKECHKFYIKLQWVYFQQIINLNNTMSLYYSKFQKHQQATQLLQQVIRLQQHYYNRDDQRHILAYNNMACAYYEIKDKKYAQKYIIKCNRLINKYQQQLKMNKNLEQLKQLVNKNHRFYQSQFQTDTLPQTNNPLQSKIFYN